jgi:tRNA (guanine-N7-)-methyltransferase
VGKNNLGIIIFLLKNYKENIMPHIKIKSLDTKSLDTIVDKSSIIKFRADAQNGGDYLFGVELDNEEFLLQLKRDNGVDMFKYDKVTRPLKVNIIKKALKILADELSFDVLHNNINQSKSEPPLSSEYFKKIKDFEDIEFPFDEVSIEVGFGSGRHLLYQANKNPSVLFIGIEIHTPSAQQVLRQIELQELKNIWVVNYDARLFLEMMPSNLCSQVFVHFPVPWDKKPHRRVISPSFNSEALRVLKVDGLLELRTDSDKYFWYSLDTFFKLPKADVTIEKNKDLEITSKYEARWKRQEKSIYEVHLKSMQNSPEKTFDISFTFNDISYNRNIKDNLPKKAIVENGYFIHFERVYSIGESSLIIKCAFGSFDRPEHKYILITKELSKYYSSIPVKTEVNYQAHKKIMEFLNV